MDNSNQLACLSLCTGYGGIELGLERAGVPLRPIAYVEREAFAAANLVAKIEAEQMAPAPVWTDVKTFPYSDFHGRVDILLAGYPCQPFSAAGQRKGEADERHLWPFIARGIAACQPRLVFAENVEGHLSLGIKDVFNDLGRMGYEYTAGLFSAEEVGASHRRKRLFWLAYSGSARSAPWFSEPQQWQKRQPEVADNNCRRGWPAGPGQSQHEWEEPRQTESQLGGTTNGIGCRPDATANRVDRLRLLGNGVVPQTAAKAWVTLWERLNN